MAIDDQLKQNLETNQGNKNYIVIFMSEVVEEFCGMIINNTKQVDRQVCNDGASGCILRSKLPRCARSKRPGFLVGAWNCTRYI